MNLRNIYLLLLIGTALIATGCASRRSAEKSESGSAVEAESESLQSPDLALHFLQGPVYICETIETPATIEADGAWSAPDNAEGTLVDSLTFSSDGLLLSQISYRIYEGEMHPATSIKLTYNAKGDFLKGTDTSVVPPLGVALERNPYGEITLITVGLPDDEADASFAYRETFTWSSGRLDGRELHADEVQSRTRYSYSEGSDPASATVRADDIEQTSVSTETYTYTRRDSCGNWTERRVEISTEGRAYEVDAEPAGTPASESKTYRLDRRRITYRQ